MASMTPMPLQDAMAMTPQQQRAVHALMMRGWNPNYRGAISGDVYLFGIGNRCLAVLRDGSQERLS